MKNLFIMKILVILSIVVMPLHLILSPKSQIAAASISSRVSVMVSDLNIREDANISSKIIGKAHLGDKFETIRSKNGWVQIKLSESRTGWVYQAYVTSTKNIEATVEALVLNVRKQPNLSSSVTAKLKSGTKITVLEEQAEWAKIKSSSGVRGWVYEYYITKNTPDSGQGQAAAPTQTGQAAAQSADSKLMLNGQDPLKGKTIVLDPGHGGYDDGTTSISGTHEKALTLATAKTVEQKLANAGANVIMTRTSDTYIPLQQRADLSKQNHADAFISFHYNWSNNPSAEGLTDFYYQKAKDDPLAADILKDVGKTTQLNIDGTKFDNLDVLRNNTQPSTLLELGFLSSKQDDSLVENSSYRDKVAQGVYLGLLDYFSNRKNN